MAPPAAVRRPSDFNKLDDECAPRVHEVWSGSIEMETAVSGRRSIIAYVSLRYVVVEAILLLSLGIPRDKSLRQVNLQMLSRGNSSSPACQRFSLGG